MEAQWSGKIMENPSPNSHPIPTGKLWLLYGSLYGSLPQLAAPLCHGSCFRQAKVCCAWWPSGPLEGWRGHFPYQMQVLWLFKKGKYGKWDNHWTDWNFSAMFDYRRVFTYWTNRISSVCSDQPTQRLGGKNSRNTHPPHRFHFTCFTLKNLAKCSSWIATPLAPMARLNDHGGWLCSSASSHRTQQGCNISRWIKTKWGSPLRG